MNRFIVLIAILISPHVNASEAEKQGESYLCLGESAAGVIYKNEEWDSARLAAEDEKWIINRASSEKEKDEHEMELALKKGGMDIKWAFREFGDSSAIYCTDFNDYETLSCRWSMTGWQAKFSKKTGLFQIYRPGGYVEGYHHDSAMVVVGKCSRID